MGVMKINCGYCSGSWEVYSRDMKYDKARTCPHCLQHIERQTWEKQILPAFGMLDDVNRELFKDHTGYHKPLFSVSYEPDLVFKYAEQNEIAADLSNMKADIEAIKDGVTECTETLILATVVR